MEKFSLEAIAREQAKRAAAAPAGRSADARHAVHALEDSAILLTVSKALHASHS